MRRWIGLAARLALGLGVLALGLPEGCHSATQVTVELDTFPPLQCAPAFIKRVYIVVAATPADAEARMDQESYSTTTSSCDSPSRVGTLVITPEGGSGAIVVAVATRDDSKCRPSDGYQHCIVARRTFEFIDHVGLRLPIALEASCEDVPCDVQTSCRTGACVSSTSSCDESSGACQSNAQPALDPQTASTAQPTSSAAS